MSFGVIFALIVLGTGTLLFTLLSFGAAWLMATSRVYGNDEKDLERSKRMIEAYSRACVVCALCAGLFGAAFYVILIKFGNGCLL